MKDLYLLPRRLLIGMVRLYQKTLSPDHGIWKDNYPFGYCKYTPTCSCYAIDALKKKGALLGSTLALWRVLRCNPWSKGGVDEVR